jgi:hypothetical protein
VLKFLSSIFNFEAVRQTGRPPAGFYKALLVAAGLICLAEGFSRWLLSPVGRNWEYWSPEAATQFEEYRRQTELGQGPEVLIVGDSTGQCDLDPLVISDSLPGQPKVYNLAAPANFPFAFRHTTLSLLRAQGSVPRLVIASFSVGGFVDSPQVLHFEQQILDSPYCRHWSGEFVASDYISLLRLMTASPFIRNRYRPVRDSQQQEMARDRALTNHASLAGGATGGDFGTAGSSKEMNSRRFDVVRDLGALAQARQFNLLVIEPPMLSNSWDSIYAEYARKLEQAQKDYGFSLLDSRHCAFLTEAHFTDNIHLNPDGARIFSKDLARSVVPVLLAAFTNSAGVYRQASIPRKSF